MTFDSESIKYSNKPIVICKIEFYEGDEYLSNHERVISVSSVLTQVEARILSFGSISRSVSDIYGSFEISDITTVLSNIDNRYSSYDLEALFNVNVSYFVGFNNDDFSDYKNIFSGSVYDFEFSNNSLTISVKDHVSKKIEKKFGHYIKEDDWPKAASDITGLRMPIVYGDVSGSSSIKEQSVVSYYGEYYFGSISDTKTACDKNGTTLIIFVDPTYAYLQCIAAFYGNPVTHSNTLTLNSSPLNGSNDVVYDSANSKFLVIYVKNSDKKTYVRTITASGSTISQSAETLVKDATCIDAKCCYDSTNELVVCSFIYYIANPYILTYHGSVSGWGFQDGETCTGGTSGASGQLYKDYNNYLYLYNVTGTFQASEVVTGTTSGSTTTISSVQSIYGSELITLSIDLSSGISLNNETIVNYSGLITSGTSHLIEFDSYNATVFYIYRLYGSSTASLELCEVNGSDMDSLYLEDDLNTYLDFDGAANLSVVGMVFDSIANHMAIIFNASLINYVAAIYYDADDGDIYKSTTEDKQISYTGYNFLNWIFDDYSNCYYIMLINSAISNDIIVLWGARFFNGSIDFEASTKLVLFDHVAFAGKTYLNVDDEKLVLVTEINDITGSNYSQNAVYLNAFNYANIYIPFPNINSSKCYCIDIINNIWLVAGHEIYEIGNCYTTDIENDQDSTKFRTDDITKTTDYSYSGGLDSKIAIIQFNENPPSPNDRVYVDCKGMIDGIGDLIENPITALEHFLTEYLGFTSSDYDTSVLAEAETEADNRSYLIGNVITPYDEYGTRELIESWARSFGAVIGFNYDGKFIIKLMG